MRVEPLLPDAPPFGGPSAAATPAGFAKALDALGAILGGAERAEDAFAMAVERCKRPSTNVLEPT